MFDDVTEGTPVPPEQEEKAPADLSGLVVGEIKAGPPPADERPIHLRVIGRRGGERCLIPLCGEEGTPWLPVPYAKERVRQVPELGKRFCRTCAARMS